MNQYILFDSQIYNEKFLRNYILNLHSFITREGNIEESMPKIINSPLSIEEERNIVYDGKYTIVKEMKNLLDDIPFQFNREKIFDYLIEVEKGDMIDENGGINNSMENINKIGKYFNGYKEYEKTSKLMKKMQDIIDYLKENFDMEEPSEQEDWAYTMLYEDDDDLINQINIGNCNKFAYFLTNCGECIGVIERKIILDKFLKKYKNEKFIEKLKPVKPLFHILVEEIEN